LKKHPFFGFDQFIINPEKVSKHIPKANNNRVAKHRKIQLIEEFKGKITPFFSIPGKFLLFNDGK
jgi:hypothetical protein